MPAPSCNANLIFPIMFFCTIRPISAPVASFTSTVDLKTLRGRVSSTTLAPFSS